MCAGADHRLDRRDKTKRGHENFVSFANIERAQSEEKSVGSARHADTMGRVKVVRSLALEGGHLGPQNVAPASKHTHGRSFELRGDGGAASREVDHRQVPRGARISSGDNDAKRVRACERVKGPSPVGRKRCGIGSRGLFGRGSSLRRARVNRSGHDASDSQRKSSK